MKPLNRRLVLAACLAAAPWATPVLAQTAYPSKPIRIIVPTAPGGGYDVIGRLVAERLGQELGQSIVVENRTGAGTLVGTQFVANAAPDGYTLVVGGLANMALLWPTLRPMVTPWWWVVWPIWPSTWGCTKTRSTPPPTSHPLA